MFTDDSACTANDTNNTLVRYIEEELKKVARRSLANKQAVNFHKTTLRSGQFRGKQ
jgi:hypothetical protein